MRLPAPRSEIYLRGDFQNILRAVAAANATGGEYGRGFHAALRAVAVAIDVDPPAQTVLDAASRRAVTEPRQTPSNEFEALLMGLDAKGLAAFRQVVDVTSRCATKPERDAVIDEYIRRLDAGEWPPR